MSPVGQRFVRTTRFREATLRTLTAILQGGRESVVGVADLLTEAGKGDDSKARYALHALAVQVAGEKNDGA